MIHGKAHDRYIEMMGFFRKLSFGYFYRDHGGHWYFLVLDNVFVVILGFYFHRINNKLYCGGSGWNETPTGQIEVVTGYQTVNLTAHTNLCKNKYVLLPSFSITPDGLCRLVVPSVQWWTPWSNWTWILASSSGRWVQISYGPWRTVMDARSLLRWILASTGGLQGPWNTL